MRWTKLSSTTLVDVRVSDYLINWDRVVSKPQKKVKDFLRPYWKAGVVLEEVRIPGSLLRIDLIHLGRKIAVEVSPKSTHSFSKFFHVNRITYSSALKRELQKEAWAKRNGFKFIEILEEDLNNLSPEWFKKTYDVTL
jgi:hypothetical protein